MKVGDLIQSTMRHKGIAIVTKIIDAYRIEFIWCEDNEFDSSSMRFFEVIND